MSAREFFRRLDEFHDLPSVIYPGGQGAWLYCLEDPLDNTVRYIGVTGSPKSRLHWHLKEPTRCLKAWFDDLAVYGRQPRLRVLGKVGRSNWDDVEASWILYFRERAAIYNEHHGGAWKTRRGKQVETRGRPRFRGKKEPPVKKKRRKVRFKRPPSVTVVNTAPLPKEPPLGRRLLVAEFDE